MLPPPPIRKRTRRMAPSAWDVIGRMGQNQKLCLSINRMLAHFGDPAISEERELELVINQTLAAIDHQQHMMNRT